MRMLRGIMMRILLVAMGLSFAVSAVASPFTPLNVKVALECADAIYVVEIAAVDGVSAPTDEDHPSPSPDVDVHARVLAAIKGPDVESIHIIVPQRTDRSPEGTSYARFRIGEVSLVFLTGKSSPFSLVDPDPSNQLDVVRPDRIGFRYSRETAYDKLATTLMWTVNLGSGRTRLEAIRQLGFLGDHRAASLLRQFAKSDDLALRSLSLEARIHVGDPPDVNDMLAILDMTTESIDANQSRSGYTGFRYGSEYLQILLLDAVCQSIIPEESLPFNPLPVSKLEGFDYIAFIAKALNTKAGLGIPDARYRLVGALGVLKEATTTPVLIGSLGDENAQVRWTATWALYRIHGGLEPAGGVDAFIRDEAKYQTYWKAFWKDHKKVPE